jgi:hypothetical protein
MGVPFEKDTDKVLQPGSKHTVEPDLFAKDGLGKRKGGTTLPANQIRF